MALSIEQWAATVDECARLQALLSEAEADNKALLAAHRDAAIKIAELQEALRHAVLTIKIQKEYLRIRNANKQGHGRNC